MNKEQEMAKIAYNALDEKKAVDIKILDIKGVSVIADYFVIASGTSSTQVQALVENVEEKLSKAGFEPKQVEGIKGSSWMLLDYGDVIVHIFDEENRLFYDLERIWRDGKLLSIDDLEK